jgi:hypothetical protein
VVKKEKAKVDKKSALKEAVVEKEEEKNKSPTLNLKKNK